MSFYLRRGPRPRRSRFPLPSRPTLFTLLLLPSSSASSLEGVVAIEFFFVSSFAFSTRDVDGKATDDRTEYFSRRPVECLADFLLLFPPSLSRRLNSFPNRFTLFFQIASLSTLGERAARRHACARVRQFGRDDGVSTRHTHGNKTSIRTFAPTIVYISFTFLSFSLEGSAEKRGEKEKSKENEKKNKNPCPPSADFSVGVYNRDRPISVIAVYGGTGGTPLILFYPRPGDEKPSREEDGRGWPFPLDFIRLKANESRFLSSRSRVSSGGGGRRRWRAGGGEGTRPRKHGRAFELVSRSRGSLKRALH